MKAGMGARERITARKAREAIFNRLDVDLLRAVATGEMTFHAAVDEQIRREEAGTAKGREWSKVYPGGKAKGSKTTEWVGIEEFGSFFRVEDGVLMAIPMMADGTMDQAEDAIVEVVVAGDTEEEAARFCEVINGTFETAFVPADFPGR